MKDAQRSLLSCVFSSIQAVLLLRSPSKVKITNELLQYKCFSNVMFPCPRFQMREDDARARK